MNIASLDFVKDRTVPIASVSNQEAHGRINDAVIADEYKEKAFDLCTTNKARQGYKYTVQALAMPKILNPVLCTLTDDSTSLSLLKLAALDLDFNWKSIIYGDVVYSIDDQNFIKTDKLDNVTYDEHKFKICGECVELVLSKFDKSAIQKSFIMSSDVSSTEKLQKIEERYNKIASNEARDLNDEVELSNIDMLLEERGKKGNLIEVCGIEFRESSLLLQKLLKSNNCLLDELYRDPTVLTKFIMDKLYVLPNMLRPYGAVSSDPLTKKYLEILNNINDYNITKESRCSVKHMVKIYNKLQKSVTSLFKEKEKVADTSLVDKVTHKEGIIRKYCLGERVDFSARSVITVNSKLRTGWIGLPRKIAYKIFENTLLRTMEVIKGINRYEYLRTRTLNEIMDDLDIFNGAPVLIGRQPTLFYLGIQLRYVEIIDGSAIEVSPLDVTAFGADFDGDTMHIEAFPNMGIGGPEQDEVYNGKTFYYWQAKDYIEKSFKGRVQYVYPKDGSPTREIRQDMTYGLVTSLGFFNTKRLIYNETNYNGIPEEDMNNVIDLISKNKLSPYAIVEGCDYTVAQAIIGYVLNMDPDDWKYLTGQHLTKDGVTSVEQARELINAGMLPETVKLSDAEKVASFKRINIDKIVLNELNGEKDKYYLQSLDILKDLGFAVAKVFPPDLDIISSREINELLGVDYEELVSKTRRDITNNLNSSLVSDNDDSAIRSIYKGLNKYEKKLQESDLNNGWTGVIKSGARGGMINVQQTLLTKGFIQDCSSAVRSNAILSNYAKGITNYENFIIANGGRAALVDKSISTAEPGYLSRKLSYCCSNIKINNDDCGTEETFPISLDLLQKTQKYFKHVIDGNEEYIVRSDAYKFFKTHLTGRWIKTETGDVKIGKDNILEYFNRFYDNKETINLYSPVFCINRCCKKCYGDDIRGIDLYEGERVGYIAAQAVSEPSTQLTMKKFQKGGIETQEDLSSAISVLERMLNGTKDLEYLDYGEEYAEINVRNLAIKTVYEILNILWNNEGKVNIKHIEVVVSACIRYVIPGLGAGKGYVRNKDGKGIPVFYGLEKSIKYCANAIERIAFEDLARGLFSTIITSNLNEGSIIERMCLGAMDKEDD